MVGTERREAVKQRVTRRRHIRRVHNEMMSAARRAVLVARSRPGFDPEVVDRVLRHLDVRSLH
ncbi:hypothetical protein GCM10009753_12380 [Streptantibioticus ferralitis]